MEKIFAIFKLGAKYLYCYRRRYYFLMAALVFGFTVISFSSSVKDGMYDSAYYSAQSHYAGDIVAIGYDTNTSWGYSHHLGGNEISAILNAADASRIKAQHTVLRTLYGSDAVVHFNGNAVQFKNLVGCDWDNEAHLFGKMIFEEAPEPFFGAHGMVVSVPVAKQLGAKTGDSVILELETRYGQKNTGLFVIQGIVQDVSIFGYYKAYISRLTLNRLVLYDDNDSSSIGFFLDDPAAAEQERIRLQQNVEKLLAQVGPLVYDRHGMALERDRPWKGIRVFLYTLPVYLSEISYLLDAMNIVSYFLYGMMLLTILASAAVTYRLILHERAREMGIMRVVGLYGGDLCLVLWTEIAILVLFSIAAGLILSRVLGWAASAISFSWFPGFEIFLSNGRLTALYLPKTMLINAALLLIVLFALALIPSFRVSRKNLPALLSGEPL